MKQLTSTTFELGWPDQLPKINGYTVIALGFPSPPGLKEETIKAELSSATEKLSEALPWLKGRLAHGVPEEEKGKNTHSGTYWVSIDRPGQLLRFKDLSDELPSFEEIAKAKAPMTMLPGDKIAAMPGLPTSFHPDKDDMPVFAIQVNFIKGGVLLCFATQHNVTDMVGQGQIMRLFAQAMRGEPFTTKQLEYGNIDRRSVVPPLKDGEAREDLPHLHSPTKLGLKSWASKVPVAAPWKIVRFSAGNVKKLKALAGNKSHLTNGASATAPEWISSNDAVTAFMWQRVTAVRAKRIKDFPHAGFLRSVNSRFRLDPPVPEEYIGHMVYMTYNKMPLEDLLGENGLSAAAFGLRQSVLESTDLTIRSFVDLLSKEPDKSKVDYTTRLSWERDILFSSWAENRISWQSFGSLGMPDFVRRPTFADFESCAFFVDKTRDGDFDALISLRNEDWTALEKDEAWNKYSETIG